MPENEHNGEGFHYIVSYRRYGSSDEETKRNVDDSKQRSISIHGQKEPFALFEIYVRAANRLGAAPMPDKQLVRSGEGSRWQHCIYRHFPVCQSCFISYLLTGQVSFCLGF